MEDSGFDSGEKFQIKKHLNDETETSTSTSSDNGSNANSIPDDSFDILFKGVNNSNTRQISVAKPISLSTPLPQVAAVKPKEINTCKTLQRKLELKVERAKRNYMQLHGNVDITKNQNSTNNLIPINRLQIPGHQESAPLVEYKCDEEQNCSDEDLEISFFPIRSKFGNRQELTDTFSIQEMTIESDTDDSESQNLELLLPTNPRTSYLIERLLRCLCCRNARHSDDNEMMIKGKKFGENKSNVNEWK